MLSYAGANLSTSNRNSSDLANRVLMLLLVGGIVCRIVQYLWDRSFWVDEASLVLNIRGKTAWQLLGRLDFHQAAPPLFLLAERGIFRVLGGSELSLRLFPLLAGCGSVVLFGLLARRLLRPWAAVLAVAMFCFSDRLIWHSTEAKQYGTDVFFAVLLTFVAVGQPDRSLGRRLSLLSAVAAVAVWFSYPAALVFAGLSLALLPTVIRRGVRSVLSYAACNMLVVASFCVLLVVVVRVQQSQSLAEYWAEDFLNLRHPLSIPIWLARHVFALCNYPIESMGVLVLPCALIGGVELMRSGQTRHLTMLVNPIGINLLAATAGRYPFDGARLTVYLTPAVLLLAGAGAAAVYARTRARAGRLALAPAAVLVAVALGSAAFHLVFPRYRAHIRPAVRFVRSHVQPGDGIYALQLREFECYWPDDYARVRAELDAADHIPFRRFWIVWSFPNERARHRLDGTLAWARSFSVQRLSRVYPGGCAYLFEITAPPPHSSPPDMATHHKMISPQAE